MNTIHDDGVGSEVARMRSALNREKRARAALGGAKDALEVIIGAGCVGFCRIHPTRHKCSANAHFKAHFGWPPDAILERSDLDGRIHPEDRAALCASITAALDHGTPLDLTVRAVWPCGTTHYIALRGRCAHGESAADTSSQKRSRTELVLVATNVTAEYKAIHELEAAVARESELRATAAAANCANLELLSIVSHELRSPLNAMLGWNRILAIKRGDDVEIKAITSRVQHSAKAQLRIVNDLLDLARIGTGKFKVNPRPMKLATVAASALESASAPAQAKDIEITADFTATPGETNGDAERLRQVVANLLSNAVKFTPRGGKIRLLLRRVGSDLELEVADTGQGISKELLPRVFDRVRREDAPGARHEAGLGLGLAISREIVILHGGTVRLTSDGEGLGTVVVVRLPGRQVKIPAGDPLTASLASSGPRSLSGLGILVVDDEPEARAVVAELLRLEGAEVAVSDSAASAYEKLCAQGASFDVVVTDIGMPVEDGYSLVRKLRALKSGARVLAIALTGHATSSDAATALEAGFDLHVAKPVDVERFVPMIRRFSSHTRDAPTLAE
jgi:signal transduction histidine kinase/ActR/RegA family two-component response regulator